jgi:hypothetical protein
VLVWGNAQEKGEEQGGAENQIGKRTTSKSKKDLNPAEVRKDISRMVESHVTKMAQAVIGEGEKGQLATVVSVRDGGDLSGGD